MPVLDTQALIEERVDAIRRYHAQSGIERAADRAARLLAELAGGEVAPGVAEARGEPAPSTERIALSVARTNRLLGTDISETEAAALLERISKDPPITRAMLGVLEHDDSIDPSAAARRLGLVLTSLAETLRATFIDGDPAHG